jgi:chromosome segregation ATPase
MANEVSESVDDTSEKKARESRRKLREELAQERKRTQELQEKVSRLEKELEDATGVARAHAANAQANSSRAKDLTRKVDTHQRETVIVQRKLNVALEQLSERDATIADLEQQLVVLGDRILVASKPHPPTPVSTEPRATRFRRSQRS